MTDIFGRTVNAYRQYGFWGATLAACCKLLKIRSFFICERELNPFFLPDSTVLRATSTDVLEELIRKGAPVRYLPDRVGPQDILLIHSGNNGPDGLFWLSKADFQGPIYEGLHIELGKQDIHGHFIWVAPQVRGQGIGPLLNRSADRFCLEAGCVRVVNGVSTFNRPALRADKKIGYRPILRFWTFGFLRFYYLDIDGARSCGLLKGGSKLRLSLDEVRASAVGRRKPAP